MASLLNNASLLLNPAGSIISYQEDKIYSVLPKNGTGDFTFSGGDGGTRVNQQGYVEQTPANFMLNSGTTWTPYNVTVTTGVTDPVGGTGAYTIGSIASGNITEYAAKYSNPMSLPTGTTFTYSIYMKGSGTIATYVERSVGGTYFFDMKTHTLSSEWQVFTHSYTVSADADGVGVYVGNRTGTTATSVDIAFPMLNYGSTAKPYQPTTDRLNYPRITYQNGRGALLSEPQRTNLTQGSNGLTTNWSNYRGTYTANAISSPDGTVNAPLTVWDGSSPNTVGFYFTNFSFAGSTTYCLSVFLKYYNKPIISVGYVDRSGPYLGGNAYFNIANGTFVSVDGSATTGIIEPYKDGWYRCTVVFTTVASPSYNYLSIDSGNVVTGEGFYIYGSQLEAGTYPTSYIPTTSATVTRPRDTTENSSASSVIGQTEGVLYTDFSWNILKGADDFLILTISDGTTTNNIFLDIYNDQVILGMDSGGRVVQITSSTITTGRHKIAGGYKNNDFVLYLDGKQIGTDSSGTVPACSVIDVGLWANGAYPFAGNLNTVGLFNTRLTNTQLQELTTVRSGSGGNISYYGPYTIHTFTGSATFTPSFTGPVEVLVVAGGGAGGGGDVGGGGGAGGLLYVSSYGVSQSTGITVTIGAGGAGVQNASLAGGNGSNSVFGGLTAIGGGGGAGWTKGTGNDGGSGGGATFHGVGGKGIPGQGNDGGTGGVAGAPYPQCGGGGAGQIGLPATGSTIAGNGGAGLPYSISGFSTYYAGGGGGATEGNANVPGTPGTGGLGGGGNGGSQGAGTLGKNGVDGLGGGGGGCDPQAGATGGSGIVIVRYLT